MNRIIITSLLITFMFSCDDTSWKAEIENLQKQIDANKNLITLLQANVYVTNIEDIETGYLIEFSDNSSLIISDGYVTVITIGENGNWVVNGIDTGQLSQGITPEITIGENGNWFIDGIDTGQPSSGMSPEISIGNDGNWIIDGVNSGQPSSGEDGVYINSIIMEENIMTFGFSDGSSIELEINSGQKKIVCWGNSLTVGAGGGGVSFPLVIQNNLGSDYQIINAGVGGENSLTIAARQGGIPMLVDTEVKINGTDGQVEIGDLDNPNLKSNHDNSNVRPLRQGGGSTINSCYIDNNEYYLRWIGTAWNDPNQKYTLELISEKEETVNIPSGSIIITSSMRNHRNAYANVFFIGQNGGFVSNSDLVDQINKMIEFSGTSNYVVIGLHAKGTVDSMRELEGLMKFEFGARFINLRDYMIREGLSDAGLDPTTEDITAIESGRVPPQLLSDGVHFNSIGYTLIGNLITQRMKLLGI